MNAVTIPKCVVLIGKQRLWNYKRPGETTHTKVMEKETSCINVIAILDYLKHQDIDYSAIIADLSPES